MVAVQRHRGPDSEDIFVDQDGLAGLGHNRLSIIDLSETGRQPMISSSGRYVITLNGEIYNYLELRRELEAEFSFRSTSDTEVLLAAYEKWSIGCLEKLIGMFAFVIWDQKEKTAFAARDRFGVKPLYFHEKPDGTLLFASEIKTIHAAGVDRVPNEKTWSNYLSLALYDHSNETFWKNISALPPGHFLEWKNNRSRTSCWYDLAERTGNELDGRSETDAAEEYLELLKDSVRLRFRSDVPVGVSLSGGLDSSTLLGLVHSAQGDDSDVKVFTFVTGDKRYDELPWVEKMLAQTKHPLIVCGLRSSDVPSLAAEVQYHQDEPFGGLPTLAYATVFEKARENGVTVLLDGNGMDEQWAGYDYYQPSLNGAVPGLIQGTKERSVRPECLTPEFRALAEAFEFPKVFDDKIRNLQYRDTRFTKIPRAMRFNDRISMKYSTELREPFLDHRLFELAIRQPTERKINTEHRKVLLRRIAKGLIGDGLAEPHKRPVQTPQREWLRGELAEWASEMLRVAKNGFAGSWLDHERLDSEWKEFRSGKGDNSFFVWQWISIGLMAKAAEIPSGSKAAVRS